jgi:hypothetical protein
MGYVSVDKAARILLVSRSTVLKWVAQQKLSAREKADAGYLVDRDSLRRILTMNEDLIEEIVNGMRPVVPCWEYHAEDGVIQQECRGCPVFKDGKITCYEVGKFLKESGRGASCCPTDCEDCSYYRSQKRAERADSAFPGGDVPHDSRNTASN